VPAGIGGQVESLVAELDVADDGTVQELAAASPDLPGASQLVVQVQINGGFNPGTSDCALLTYS
jgi:hypothetical protein